jgi:hypothetical protein
MRNLILLFVVAVLFTACHDSKPKIIVFNMSEDERPCALEIDAIEGDTIYVSPSVFEDTSTRSVMSKNINQINK